MKDKFRILTTVLFVMYLAVLMKLLIFRQGAMGFGGGNFVPLKTIFNYLDDAPTLGIALRNLGGNIMIFVPLGFFIPLLHRTSKWKAVLIIAFVASLTFEIIQGVFKVGIFDVDDILLNALGAMIGYWVFVCIKSVVLKRQTSFEKDRH